MKWPRFEAKMGVWGQYGWKRITFIQCLWGWLNERVVRIVWERKGKDGLH